MLKSFHPNKYGRTPKTKERDDLRFVESVEHYMTQKDVKYDFVFIEGHYRPGTDVGVKLKQY